MEEAFGFFRAFEFWIYLFIGLAALFFIRKFILAWQELRNAAFGMEREGAQARLNQSATGLVFLVTLAVAEFVLVYFIAPTIPEANVLPTASFNPLATLTITLPAITQVGEGMALPEGTLQPVSPLPAGCIPGQLQIIFPAEGQEVSGVVEVNGTADSPNFGFYKMEIKRPEDMVWLTLQAGNQIVREAKLGDWDTRQLTPGEYDLSLVIVDNQAQPSAPCQIRVRVARAPEETISP